ncbi:MAG: hypothetical protein ACK5V3_02795 [Bdellovibrionales bacterium]
MDHQIRLSILSGLIFLFVVTGCGGNFFEESSGKTTEAALTQAIKTSINDLDYDTAIDLIENSGIVADTREKKNLFASAYAGKCGVSFAGLIDALGAPAGTLFNFFMSSFQSITTDAASCEQARVYLESVGLVTERTLAENLSYFLVGFGKIGAHLKENGDTAAPFGTFDGGFDACAVGDLPAADVQDMMSGFGMMIDTSLSISAFLGGTLGADLTTIGTVCGASCVETDPTQITSAPDILSFRRIVASTEYGANTCALAVCCP